LTAEGFDASEDGTGRGTPIVATGKPMSNTGSAGTSLVAFGIGADAVDRSGEGSGGTAGERSGLNILEECQPTLRARSNNAIAFHNRQDPDVSGDVTHPLGAKDNGMAVAFQTRFARNGRGAPEEICPTLQGASAGASSDMRPCVSASTGVRRLMPVECCRLQGFPDDWLDLDPPLADGPKYRMLGNAVAVPVAEWIGRRIVEHA
jgi:DNA (cytosine-5)-methyltransferase 1